MTTDLIPAPPPPTVLKPLRCEDCNKLLGKMKDVPGSFVEIECRRCGKRTVFRVG